MKKATRALPASRNNRTICSFALWPSRSTVRIFCEKGYTVLISTGARNTQHANRAHAPTLTYKVDADGAHVRVDKGVVCEAQHQTRLADARVADEQQLENVVTAVATHGNHKQPGLGWANAQENMHGTRNCSGLMAANMAWKKKVGAAAAPCARFARFSQHVQLQRELPAHRLWRLDGQRQVAQEPRARCR